MKEILSKRLRICRNDKKFSQRMVARCCGISEKAYQNYELMTREPRLEIIIRIADLYNVSIDYLVGRSDG